MAEYKYTVINNSPNITEEENNRRKEEIVRKLCYYFENRENSLDTKTDKIPKSYQ